MEEKDVRILVKKYNYQLAVYRFIRSTHYRNNIEGLVSITHPTLTKNLERKMVC